MIIYESSTGVMIPVYVMIRSIWVDKVDFNSWIILRPIQSRQMLAARLLFTHVKDGIIDFFKQASSLLCIYLILIFVGNWSSNEPSNDFRKSGITSRLVAFLIQNQNSLKTMIHLAWFLGTSVMTSTLTELSFRDFTQACLHSTRRERYQQH